jgi:hypothetical protein
MGRAASARDDQNSKYDSDVRVMGRRTAPTSRRRRRPFGLALAAGILAALTLAPTSAPAAQDGAPFIESVGSGAGSAIAIDAKINPEGLETSYEIGLECSPCRSGDQWTKGTLPAVNESREVTLALTGLQPGHRYWFAVRALNNDGEAFRRGETLEIPPPVESFPEGTGGGGIVRGAPPTEAQLNELRAIGIHEEERRTKAKEQEDGELAIRPASELQHTEAQPPAASARTELHACLVPALKGDTLATARHALARAHCRLGAVHRPSHYDGALYVDAQGVPAGEHLAHGARVALRIGAKQASHRD